MTNPAVHIQGVTKRFGTKLAVDNLDLVVPRGSVCGFLGPNGAGKTTTIRMIMHIIFPDSGTIEVLGKSSADESRANIGYVPEERGVYKKMKVGDFLDYMARLKGAPKHGLSKHIDDWLEKVDLGDVRKKKCEELSKGMQQKVQFLAAVLHDPELLILDEPFSGLDPVNARLLRSLIEEQRQLGKTIIFSTHVLSSAEQLCDRVFMINRGKKVLDGPLDAIRAKFDPRTVVVEPAGGPEHTAAMRAALAACPAVGAVTALAGQNTLLEARLVDGADPNEAMRAALAAGDVRKIEVRRATLEDIFVQLVAPADSEDSAQSVRAALRADAPMEASADA